MGMRGHLYPEWLRRNAGPNFFFPNFRKSIETHLPAVSGAAGNIRVSRRYLAVDERTLRDLVKE
jgi:hypothetical protein